jgi:hypothetical protein
MHPVIETTSRPVLFASLFFLSVDGIAAANNLGAQKKALEVIIDFADRLCTTIPLTGSADNAELSGNAKAELSEVLKKIANLGIEGAAKYQTSDWQGVLQQDLAGQLNNSRNCKLEVFKDLKEKLLAPVDNPPITKPESRTEMRPESQSVSFVSPKSGEKIRCVRGADGLYQCSTSGISSGVSMNRHSLLLWVRPVSPPSEISGWYLQRGRNGISMTGTSGAWNGVAQLGNVQYPPHEGDMLDLAVTVTDIETATELEAEALKAEAGTVVRDEPIGEKIATRLGIIVTLQK